MSQDTNRYFLHSRMRYSVTPFHKGYARIKRLEIGEADTTWLNAEIDEGERSPVGIGTADCSFTFLERLKLFFSRRWLVAIYVPQSEVTILSEFEIHDRHAGLVPGVPEVARTLPDHNRAEANAFCDELNRQYNKNPGVVRRDTPMSTEELQRSVAQMRKR